MSFHPGVLPSVPLSSTAADFMSSAIVLKPVVLTCDVAPMILNA